MYVTESLPPKDTLLLNDSIASALEHSGLWRRAASRWLVILDQAISEQAREHIALRREACLLMSSGNADGDTGAKRRKSYRQLLDGQHP